ncbi:MAG: Fe-S cluster assembly protein SufD, partial [Corynebacterium sp.]|nr:Fe-S cluster assembly protein SufD [Corynebacterium sp.]
MATATVKNASGENNKGDAFTSFNVDDFAVPGGRDEVWRFIALRRIRGLHNGKFAPATEQDVQVEAAENVTVETVSKDDERLGTAGAPVDRVAAQAWTSMESAQLVTVAANEQVAEPIRITITGKGEDVTSFGATSV